MNLTRCTQCILPTTLPGVAVDQKGICNYCHAFPKARTNGASPEVLRQRFARYLRRVEGRKGYQCLVPVSGGKDSMYVLYVLAQEFGLNVLAYNFDNGFQSERARQNIQRAVKKLGVELIVFKPREDVLFQLYKTFLVRTGEFCTPCNMMIGAVANTLARKFHVPLVATGGSDRHSSAVYGMSMSQYMDRRYYRAVIDGQIEWGSVRQYVAAHPVQNGLRRLSGRAPEQVNVLSYFHPGAEQMQQVLESELGWESPSEELEHGDCLLNPLKDYLMNKRWGYSELTQAYSSLVRAEEMTRDEALCRAEREEVREEPAIVHQFLEKIGASYDEYLQGQRHHFTEYPNHKSSRYFKVGQRMMSVLRPRP